MQNHAQSAERPDEIGSPALERVGSLDVVGTGIRTGAQTTPEALACIRNAQKLFYLCADALTEHWLKRENATSESLSRFYAPGKDRGLTYDEIVQCVLAEVFSGKRVCFASYGHPGVFAFSTHESIRRARAAGYRARMIAGISADACLYADLGIDPADSGLQSFEATDFLVHHRKHDPRSALILWQIGIIGEWGFKAKAAPWNPQGLTILTDALRLDYDERHEVVVYEASPYVMYEAAIARVPLSQLPHARVTPLSTLYVPPGEPAYPDLDLLRRFGVERAAGIEPALSAWKAEALPLCNAREEFGQGWIRTSVQR